MLRPDLLNAYYRTAERLLAVFRIHLGCNRDERCVRHAGTLRAYLFAETLWNFWRVLLVAGWIEMIRLKLRSDRSLGADAAFGGEVAFVGFSGLALYVLGQTAIMPALLAIHLGAVLVFFLLMPFTKMAHGFYRLTALTADAVQRD